MTATRPWRETFGTGRPWRAMAVRFGWMQLGCLFVTAMLVSRGAPVGPTALHSAVIGTLCWVLIDGGRLAVLVLLARTGHGSDAASPLACRDGWPGWRWMAPLSLLGGVGGFWLGVPLSNMLLGQTTHGLPPWPPLTDGVPIVSLGAALVITASFYARARIAAADADLAALRRQAAEAQLALLQSQLEPHMLFNTLANLRALIELDAPRAQQMLDHLIAFLRSTLAASRTVQHPLADEFARIGDYLALMGVRMGPRLAADLQLPATLAAEPVPPLLLQPLVENAIRHGLEPQVAGGRIVVAATVQDSRLVLTVRDTGAGIALPVAGERAAGDEDGRAPGGFGLAQVRERLATRYGDQAAFDIGPAGDADGGTLARIELPLAAAAPAH